MERIAEIISKKLIPFVSALFGLIVPGGITIIIFKMDYFIELDILKLILLSFIISAPVFGYIFLITLMAYEEGNMYQSGEHILIISSIFTLFIFTLVAVYKIICTRVSIKKYVIAIIIFALGYTLLQSEKIRKNISNNENE